MGKAQGPWPSVVHQGNIQVIELRVFHIPRHLILGVPPCLRRLEWEVQAVEARLAELVHQGRARGDSVQDEIREVVPLLGRSVGLKVGLGFPCSGMT